MGILIRDAGAREQALVDDIVEPGGNGVLVGIVAIASGRVEQVRLVLVECCRIVEERQEVTEEQALVRGHLEVEARDVLLVGAAPVLHVHVTTAAIRIEGWIDRRQHARDLERQGMEQRRIDLIVHEWKTQRPRSRHTRHGERTAEIAAKHLRRQDGLVGGWRLNVLRNLGPKEKEQLVLPDRPADRSPELIALQAVVTADTAVLPFVEKCDRIERMMAHEVERIAVKGVRP